MQEFLAQNSWVVLVVSLWSLPWKGLALWRAARFKDKLWFVLLLVVNTIGILDIIYVFVIAKKRRLEN